MSQLFGGPGSFEDRLKLAFRGDAGEQRKAQREFSKSRGPLLPITLGSAIQRATGANIFKSNLGGTNR